MQRSAVTAVRVTSALFSSKCLISAARSPRSAGRRSISCSSYFCSASPAPPDDPLDKNQSRIRGGAVQSSFFTPLIGESRIAKPSIYVDIPKADNLETLIYNAFKDADDLVPIMSVFRAISDSGIPLTDPRLRRFMENLEEIRRDLEIDSIHALVLDEQQLYKALEGSLVVLSRAFTNQFRIPDFPDFKRTIDVIYWECHGMKEGQSAQYISQLARVDPHLWGVSLCTIDGQRYSVGDADNAFTIQSCSKPLSYALALNELGRAAVHDFVGKEPSGRMFNSLRLDFNNKPHNPMINAGAMVICSLLMANVHPEMDSSCKFEFVANYLKRLAGNEFVAFSNSVFLSEKSSANRNSAIAYHLMDNKCFPSTLQVKDILDFYFQCCSFELNCESLSVVAATLANGGICPVTGEQVLKSDAVRDVLTLMHSCGMYDYSGQFAFHVGLPAKSGVSGATMVVVPGVMGLACYSPPLDALGNSVKGLRFCEKLVNVYNFHRFDDLLQPRTGSKDPRQHKYDSIGLRIVNLLFAAAAGDIPAIRRHYLSGMDVNIQNYDGRTALHLAAAEGHESVVNFLVSSCQADVTVKDRWGKRAIDDAKRFGHSKVIELLETVELKKAETKGPPAEDK